MRRRKLIGITIIVTSILMQIGYATAAGQISKTVSTKELAVDFLKNPVVTHTENISVVTTVDKGVVNIAASNLYPGGKFGVTSTVVNKGEYDAIVTGVELVEKQGEDLSHELFTSLVGYSANQTIEDYNTHLQKTYVGKVLEVGQTVDIPLVMGMPVEETGLQNTKTQFSLLLHFQQKEGSTEGGGGGGHDTDKDPDQGQVTPDKQPHIPKEDVLPNEEVPVDELPIEEESIPLTEIEPVTKSEPIKEINPIEEEITLPRGGLLPKTGGVTPVIVYGLGIVLLGTGIAIYRKNEE